MVTELAPGAAEQYIFIVQVDSSCPRIHLCDSYRETPRDWAGPEGGRTPGVRRYDVESGQRGDSRDQVGSAPCREGFPTLSVLIPLPAGIIHICQNWSYTRFVVTQVVLCSVLFI